MGQQTENLRGSIGAATFEPGNLTYSCSGVVHRLWPRPKAHLAKQPVNNTVRKCRCIKNNCFCIINPAPVRMKISRSFDELGSQANDTKRCIPTRFSGWQSNSAAHKPQNAKCGRYPWRELTVFATGQSADQDSREHQGGFQQWNCESAPV